MKDSKGSVYALIMAGGVGSRFWPLSRRERPKQFLTFFGDRSLLQLANDRLDGLVPVENRFIVTNEGYVGQTIQQLPDIPEQNILAEPISRNTAPCIAFGAYRMLKLDPEGVMLVLPADHLIQDVDGFQEAARLAVEAAREPGVLVTMGIRPAHPATGFGYIEFAGESKDGEEPAGSYDVLSFKEKPGIETAQRFVESGRYLWNSGMFAWRVDTIIDELSANLPEVAEAFGRIPSTEDVDQPDAVKQAFEGSPNVSIDFGVMEKARHVKVVPCEVGWNDVGDWQAAYSLSEKDGDANVSRGEVSVIDSRGCLAYSSTRRVVLLGVEDLVVVEAGDAVLVCARGMTQRVKEAANLVEGRKDVTK
jgi:mannose-1-phosphate guanylyltransferase